MHTPDRPWTFAAAAVLLACVLASCAGLPARDPLQVAVADIESLPSEGLEMRMLVKLRVQNPNDMPVEYDGVYLGLYVMGQTFATGVSDQRGVIPRFGESVVEVPMSVSTVRIALSTLGMLSAGKPIERVTYRMEGKLNGPLFGSAHFQSQGELALPAAIAP